MEPLILMTTLAVPLIVLCWLVCVAYCVYKHIDAQETKTLTRGSSVIVVVEENTVPPTPLFTPTLKHKQDPQYAPVTSQVSSSMTLADILKKGDSGLNDSLGPTYYPKFPLNDVIDPLDASPRNVLPSPMAPLRPPWPHLPPLELSTKIKGGNRRASMGASNLNSSGSFSSFLATQALSLQSRMNNSTRVLDFNSTR